MKKILLSLLILLFVMEGVSAQTSNIRPPAIGVSFVLNDFITPQRIRTGSLSRVFRDKTWAKFREVGTGLAVHYFQGLLSHIDFAGTLAGSFVKDALPNKTTSNSEFLLEADASANFKLFTDNYWFTPYFNLGIGASKYQSYYGAFIPVGLGLKINLFDEAAIFIASQYRVPVTTETSNYHFMHTLGISGIIGQKKAADVKQAP